MDLELAGKVAIVTGGSRGIGRAIARELALEGVDVAIVARDQARLDAAAKQVASETGRRILPISADQGQDEAVRRAVSRTVEAFGRIDILVNNASGFEAPPSRVEQVNEANFREEMNSRVAGFLRFMREVAPHMKKQGWGRIINVGGLAGRVVGLPLSSIGGAAISAMTKNAADEFGRFGITVTGVHPGITRTARTDETLASRSRHFGISIQEAERRMVEEGPYRNYARRVIEAREVAYVVVFLASPKSVSISGDTVPTGGGVGPAIYY